MNRQLLIKIFLFGSLAIAAIVIYVDETEISGFKKALKLAQKKDSIASTKSKMLQQRLDSCYSRLDTIPPVVSNGKYTQAQMDEMERKIKRLESEK